jgi:fructose-1-phosphate kinase PfkB-like protein
VGASESTELAAQANEAARHYGVAVVLSLGADGAIAATGSGGVWARPAPVQAVSAVGSGDCLLAGIISRLVKGESLAEALRYGVAAGTANALRLGAGVFTLEDFNRIYGTIVVDSL